jgi:hypothetical protein
METNDPILVALMCDLSLFEESDPYSKEYNQDMCDGARVRASKVKGSKVVRYKNYSTK